MSNRPEWKDVLAYAREVFTSGQQQFMFEMERAYAEQESEEKQVKRNYQVVKNTLNGEMDTNDFDALVITAAELIREGQWLPQKLARFAADVLEKKRSRPTKRGPDPYRDYFRNSKLSFTVEAVVQKFGIARYANSDTTNNETAADAVSEATEYSLSTVTHAVRARPIPPAIVEIVRRRLGAELGE